MKRAQAGVDRKTCALENQTMAKKMIRLAKQTTHPFGLPCNGCHERIPMDEKYTEETLPSEQRMSYCETCRPIHAACRGNSHRGQTAQRIDRT